jgi:hypothetical protein
MSIYYCMERMGRSGRDLFQSAEPGYFSGIALDYGLDDRWFESRQGLGIFFFTTASRPALPPTQSLLSSGYQGLFPKG